MNMDALVFLFQIKLLVSNIRIKIFARKSPASTFQAKKLLESFFLLLCNFILCNMVLIQLHVLHSLIEHVFSHAGSNLCADAKPETEINLPICAVLDASWW